MKTKKEENDRKAKEREAALKRRGRKLADAFIDVLNRARKGDQGLE